MFSLTLLKNNLQNMFFLNFIKKQFAEHVFP